MYTHITVVPSDKLIIVDGHALHFDFPAPTNLHALQWHDGTGHREFTTDAPNQPISGAELYTAEVAPYVILWEAEKSRLEAEAAAAEAARLAAYNSVDARADRVRAERDKRISATDYLMAVDYPLGEESRAAVAAYRQSLRDLPQQDGFPWSGGGSDDSECPWPVQPVYTRNESI